MKKLSKHGNENKHWKRSEVVHGVILALTFPMTKRLHHQMVRQEKCKPQEMDLKFCIPLNLINTSWSMTGKALLYELLAEISQTNSIFVSSLKLVILTVCNPCKHKSRLIEGRRSPYPRNVSRRSSHLSNYEQTTSFGGGRPMLGTLGKSVSLNPRSSGDERQDANRTR